jgi:acetyl-CoA C-acetyltransferase
VFNICDALGLASDDARGLTVTGGLPYFGGAGNNYSMHAIASLVRLLREHPEQIGLIGANGGYLSKYSVGIYSARSASFRPFDGTSLQQRLDTTAPAPVSDPFAGAARVETYTIDHDAPSPQALVVGRSGETRIIAACADEALVGEMIDHDPLTAVVQVRTAEDGRNLVVALE